MDSETVIANLLEPVVGLDRDGTVVFANDRFLRVTGTAREALLGEEFEALGKFVGEGFPSLRSAVERAQEGATGDARVDGTMCHPESAPVPGTLPVEFRVTPVVEDGVRRGVLVILRDISERVEHERRLRRSQRRFEAVLGTPDTFIGVLEPDGTVIDVNPAALDLVDARAEDVKGDPVSLTPWWAHSDDLQDRLRGWIERAAGGEYVRFEATHVLDDGEEVPVEGVVRPVRDETGAVVSLIIEGHDVSERREYARQLERQNERLERFAGVVSHDLRNPLNIAQGQLSLAREERDSESLAMVARSLDRMEALVDDLLTLARTGDDALDIETVDLATTTAASWEAVGNSESRLAVETTRAARADRSRLRRLFENLFRNAVEHGGAGVTVTVGDLDDGFYVADDGPGIPENDREQVFENGYSTATEGTGLGLSIVRSVADAHGWDVAVTDSRGGGTRFEVRGVDRS